MKCRAILSALVLAVIIRFTVAAQWPPYSVAGEVTTKLQFGTSVIQQRNSFLVVVSNSLWKITLTPIEWLDRGKTVTPQLGFQTVIAGDGKEFYYEVVSPQLTTPQVIVGLGEGPFSVPNSELYVLWYGFASSTYLQENQGKELLPSRQLHDGINLRKGYKVPAKVNLNQTKPFLPNEIVLALGSYEIGGAGVPFLTNCIIRSYFDNTGVLSLNIPKRVTADYFVYDSLDEPKPRLATQVSVNTSAVREYDDASVADIDLTILPQLSAHRPALISDVRPLQNQVGPAVGYPKAAAVPGYGNSVQLSKKSLRREPKRFSFAVVGRVILFTLGIVGLIGGLIHFLKRSKS